MAWQYVTSGWSSTWTPSGSSLSRKVAARLYYQITETDTTYKIEVYGQECLYNDNISETIRGRLNLTNMSETTGAKTYSYSSGGTNYQSNYYTICSTKSYTWTKTKATQSATASMKSYRDGKESSIYATVTKSFTIPTLPTYTISYNVNGGSGSIASQSKWYGDSITLDSGSAFTKTNYKLVEWNTAADGSGTSYTLGTTYSTNANLTLYAIWELDTIPVKTKVSGSWKSAIVYVKVNGEWKTPHIGYVKVNGTWKQIT